MRFWKRYWALIRPFKINIRSALVWTAVTTLAGLAGPYTKKLVFDLINLLALPEIGAQAQFVKTLLVWMPSQNAIAWLGATILCAVVLADLLANLSSFLQNRALSKLDLNMHEELPMRTLGVLLKLSTGWHIRESTGKQIGQIQRGVESTIDFTEILSFSLIPTLAYALASLSVLIVLDLQIGIISLATGLLVAAWTAREFRSLRDFRQKEESLSQDFNKISTEALANIATVQIFGNEQHERDRVKNTLGQINENSGIQWQKNLSGNFSRAELINLVSILVLALSMLKLHDSVIGLGTLVMIMTMNDRFTGSIGRCSWSITQLVRKQETIDQLADLLDKKPDVVSLPTAVKINDPRGAIKFDNVTFAYNGNGAAVSQVSLDIAPGEMVALVGPSGSGKSTLVSLLVRAYDVQDGAVLIDNRDLRAIDLESWRAHIGVVPQVVELFSISIRDNIAYGLPDASDEQVVSAAKLAGAHEFIIKKEGGYQAIVGERGLDLSGGERQRIGIARAILRDPRVLIFDEATSSLDVKSERKIQEALETLRRGRTTIVIAHRFSTIKRADRVIVMDAGRVIAQGTRAELREGSDLYRELERLQSADEIRE